MVPMMGKLKFGELPLDFQPLTERDRLPCVLLSLATVEAEEMRSRKHASNALNVAA
jgi:hypothetical protein